MLDRPAAYWSPTRQWPSSWPERIYAASARTPLGVAYSIVQRLSIGPWGRTAGRKKGEGRREKGEGRKERRKEKGERETGKGAGVPARGLPESLPFFLLLSPALQ